MVILRNDFYFNTCMNNISLSRLRDKYQNEETLQRNLEYALVNNDKKVFQETISCMIKKYNKIFFENKYDYVTIFIQSFINLTAELENNKEKILCYEVIANTITEYQKLELEKEFNVFKENIEMIKSEYQQEQERINDITLTSLLTSQELKLLEIIFEIPINSDKYVISSAIYNYRCWSLNNGLNDEYPLDYIPISKKEKCNAILTDIINNFDKYNLNFRQWFCKVFKKVKNCPKL